MEGLASYADYAYTPSRAERRPFLGDRYYPYHDLQWFYPLYWMDRIEGSALANDCHI